jgi:UDP-glucose 4-epimerase
MLPHDLVLGARALPPWAEARVSHSAFRELDVLDPVQVESAVVGIDAVVHLASLDENEAARDPDLAVRVSGEGTRRLLAASRAAGVRSFIYLSTFHVYGPHAPSAIDEQTAPKPAHPYGISRLTGEGYCYENNRLGSDTSAVVFRLSNGYGAPAHRSVDRWTLAHNDFCRQAFENSRIVLKTSGVQHRDMVWIGDVAQAVERVLEAGTLEHDLFQVGNGRSLSMLQLAERVRTVSEAYLKREISVVRPAPTGEAGKAVRFSIERLRSIGFEPRDAIDEETMRLLQLLDCEKTAP